jgi:hypothetical protein
MNKEKDQNTIEVNKISYEMLSVLKDIREETNETKYNVLLVYKLIYRSVNALLILSAFYFLTKMLSGA